MGVATVGGFLGGHLAFGKTAEPEPEAMAADPDERLSPADAPRLVPVAADTN